MMDPRLGLAAFGITAVTVALWFRGIRNVGIPENRGGFIVAWIIAALTGGTALLGSPGWLGGTAAALGTVVPFVLLFTVSISRQKLGAQAIQVGDKIPTFTALDEHGERFDSESLSGHLVLIKFFRAHW